MVTHGDELTSGLKHQNTIYYFLTNCAELTRCLNIKKTHLGNSSMENKQNAANAKVSPSKGSRGTGWGSSGLDDRASFMLSFHSVFYFTI